MLLQISNSEFYSEFNHPRALAHKVHNPTIKEGSIAQRADQENTVSTLIFHICRQGNLRALSICQNWSAGPLPDQSVCK